MCSCRQKTDCKQQTFNAWGLITGTATPTVCSHNRSSESLWSDLQPAVSSLCLTIFPSGGCGCSVLPAAAPSGPWTEGAACLQAAPHQHATAWRRLLWRCACWHEESQTQSAFVTKTRRPSQPHLQHIYLADHTNCFCWLKSQPTGQMSWDKRTKWCFPNRKRTHTETKPFSLLIPNTGWRMQTLSRAAVLLPRLCSNLSTTHRINSLSAAGHFKFTAQISPWKVADKQIPTSAARCGFEFMCETPSQILCWVKKPLLYMSV